ARVDLRKDAPLQIDRREVARARGEDLRLAQEEITLRAEREVEGGEDASLRRRVEVHERVAGDEEVDARDRRILDEVVAAEDHRPAKVAAERVGAVHRLEVLLAQLGR